MDLVNEKLALEAEKDIVKGERDSCVKFSANP
jgi:hypothetical protein